MNGKLEETLRECLRLFVQREKRREVSREELFVSELEFLSSQTKDEIFFFSIAKQELFAVCFWLF